MPFYSLPVLIKVLHQETFGKVLQGAGGDKRDFIVVVLLLFSF